MIAAVLLAMVQTWTPPAYDCRGGQAGVHHYEIRTWRGEMAVQTPVPCGPWEERQDSLPACCPADEFGEPQSCPRWIARVLVLPATASSATWPDPPRGEVEVYEDVEAVDDSWNSSREGCS